MKNSDIEYASSVSAALIDDKPKSTKIILYLIFALLIVFFVWAYLTNVNQLVRGEAKVIPSGQNKIVQNFEGGIIKNIEVEEGDLVKKGDILIKIENVQYSSVYDKNVFEIEELKIRQKRLYVQANQIDFEIENPNDLTKKEYDLYLANKEQLNSKIEVLKEQVSQKQKEKNEINSNIKFLQNSYYLILKERNMIKPLAKKE